MKKLVGLLSGAALAFTVACGQTDAGITTAVKSKLAADDTVKAYKVDVDTQNKVVTLSGDVETAAQREHAVTIARNTNGVTDVIDQLHVTPTEATSGRVGDVDVDNDVEANAKQGADKVTDATKEGAQKTKAGAKKAGEAVKDVFTDDNRDSDHDGK